MGNKKSKEIVEKNELTDVNIKRIFIIKTLVIYFNKILKDQIEVLLKSTDFSKEQIITFHNNFQVSNIYSLEYLLLK